MAPSVKPEDAPGLFPKGVKQHEVPSGKVRYGCFAVVSLYTFKIFSVQFDAILPKLQGANFNDA